MLPGNLFFLKISGSIGPGKEKEFQQTVQFIFNHLPQECVDRNLSVDVNNPQHFQTYFVWSSEASLLAFKGSPEFELLRGLFQTLGTSNETMMGRQIDIQLFEFNYLDN